MVDIGHLDVPGAGVLEVRVHRDHDVVTELAATCHLSLPATCHVSRVSSPAGHVHVLARVVATDHGRGRAARRGHRERVVDAVPCHGNITRVTCHVWRD